MIGLILGAIVGVLLVAAGAYQPRRRNNNAQEGP